MPTTHRVLRTHQWIERDGARREPLPAEATHCAARESVCVMRRDRPHVRACPERLRPFPRTVNRSLTARRRAARRRPRTTAGSAGSRGGRNRVATNRPRPIEDVADVEDDGDQPELPERPIEGRIQDPEVGGAGLVRKPQIGDTAPLRAPLRPNRR